MSSGCAAIAPSIQHACHLFCDYSHLTVKIALLQQPKKIVDDLEVFQKRVTWKEIGEASQ